MTYLLVRTIAVLITSYITKVGVPIVFAWSTGLTGFVVALVLAVINHTIKPIISIVALPVTVVTLGLFSFVINALMITIASWIVPGFIIPSFWMALVFAVVLSIVNWGLFIFE